MSTDICGGCDMPFDQCYCCDDETECFYCGGEGYGVPGEDWPYQDAVNEMGDGVKTCPSCRGSGLRKDMTFC